MKITTIAKLAAALALASAAAACGSASSSPPPATTRASIPAATAAAASTTPAVTAPAAATPADTTAPIAASTSPQPSPGASLWCGQVAYGTTPVTITPLSAWLSNPNGYIQIQTLEATLRAIQASPPEATVHALATSLCFDIRGSEAFPPPAALALYGKAMNDFLQASVLLRTATAGTGAAGPYLQDGTATLDAFLTAVGKPSASS